MSSFTMYIDESGGFHPKVKEPWILAGFIAEHDPDTQIEKACELALVEIVRLLNSLHWTEAFVNRIRQRMTPAGRAHSDAPFNEFDIHYTDITTTIAQTGFLSQDTIAAEKFSAELPPLLTSLLSAVPVAYLHPGSSFPEVEVNYFSQVLELIMSALSIASSKAPAPRHYQFVIAERTSPALHTRMSGMARSQVEEAIQFGLVALGAVSLIATTDPFVTVKPVKDSPGLRIADLVCGIARKALLKDSRERDTTLLDFTAVHSILAGLGFNTYSSLDKIWLRRARTFETEGDIVRALFLHLSNSSDESETINRLTRALLTQRVARAPRYSLEQLIEEIDKWARNEDKGTVFCALIRLMDSISVIGQEDNLGLLLSDRYAMTFRLKSYSLVWANHLGRKSDAETLVVELDSIASELSFDPQLAEAISQYEIGKIEANINHHMFDEAFAEAMKHVTRIAMAANVDMGALCRGSIGGLEPHVGIRTFTTTARARLLRDGNLAVADLVAIESTLADLLSTYSDLRSARSGGPLTLTSHEVRIVQLIGFAAEQLTLMDSQRPGVHDALPSAVNDCCESLREGMDVFCLAVLLRCVATLSLLAEGSSLSSVQRPLVHDAVKSVAQLRRQYRHPEEVILREAALARKAICSSQAEISEFDRLVCVGLAKWYHSAHPSVQVLVHQRKLVDDWRKVAGKIELFPGSLDPSLQDRAAAIQSKWPSLSTATVNLLARRSTTIY